MCDNGPVGSSFDPRGSGYDYDRAIKAGMGPDGTGENAGHWGSVAPTTDLERKVFGLPEQSYVILKGERHPTFGKALVGEAQMGSKTIRVGGRTYSVPSDFQQLPTQTGAPMPFQPFGERR